VGDGVVPVAAPAGRLTSPVLVGRERELAALVEAATRPPALVVLEGEAGVGKTRLVQELLARPELGDRQRCVGACQQLGEPFPLGPVVEALRQASVAAGALSPVAGALRPLLPELADRLPASPDPLGDRRAERHRLFRAVRELLSALGTSVLVLEDLHWADDTTVELLRFLTPQLPPELTLVCTYRGEDLPAGSPLLGLAGRLPGEIQGVQISLRPFDKDQVRELVRTILEVQEVSVEFADHLLEDSGGLPFAVEEMLRLLKDRDDLVRQSGTWLRRQIEEIGVPLELRDAILERLRRLDPRAQRLVEAAAVLGTGSPESILLDTADLNDADAEQALADTLASALLLEASEGHYGFRHMLARQAVLDAISSPVLRRLHLRAADALENAEPKPHARLAHHYKAAGKTQEWIREAEAAAARAESLEDDATAYRFLEEAVGVPGLSAPTRARLAIKLADHARYCLTRGDAIAILRQMVDDEALTRGTRGELRMSLVKLLIVERETEEAYAQAIRAVEELSRRPARAAVAMLFLAAPWVNTGRMTERLSWIERAMQTAARSNDRGVIISATGQRAVVLLLAGNPNGWQAIEKIPAPGPDPDELDRATRAYNNVAHSLLHLGYLERADEFLRKSLDLLNQTAHPQQAFAQRITELQRRWLVGEWTELEELALTYLGEWVDLAPRLRADLEAVVGLLLLARGRLQDALRVLESLEHDSHGEVTLAAWVSSGLARIRISEGKSATAVHETARALDIIEQEGFWPWATDVAPVTVEALLQGGRRADANDLIRRFAAGLKGRDAPAAAAALTVCRAALDEAAGEWERAARRYLASARAWQALPRPYEAARAREGAGRCLLTHRKERGQQLLVEAMDAFLTLGATWDEARVRRTLREHGAIPPHRGGRRSYGDELSPREAEVANLAGEGLTNREIAASLFLSPKTVEQHLAAAMRKLDVSSRTELPARLEAPQQPAAARQ
jgi:DNA-binding CsgD family transcriptional regulator/tetratricopeptide (TPR) repeat protein